MENPVADYVIVGSGSAGAAMAYRLAEDGRHSVLVLEYGGTDAGPFIQMPAALSYPMNMSRYDWGYRSEPEPHLGGRRLACPRGKVIGGSSSINGMVYVRGHAMDFAAWEEMGAHGWGWRHVLPYFRRMESHHGTIDAPSEDGVRGTDGPLHVTRAAGRNPLVAAWLEAGRQAGYPVTTDYNGTRQEGFCIFDATIHQGRRWSTANAYLKPALRRSNLRLQTGAMVQRLRLDGTRATGVEALVHGRPVTVTANREVILAAGSINAPKILLLSGIGPAGDLQALGIPVVADRQGVGRNLQDHPEVYMQIRCRQPVTLNSKMNLLSKALIGAQWLVGRTGDGATNHFEAGAFIRSRAGIKYPDIQVHFLPAAVRYDGAKPIAGHGFQFHFGPMRSPSRGTVSLASADPAASPKIVFNYMSSPEDWAVFRTGVRLMREICAQPAMAPFAESEIAPGAAAQSDAAIDDWVRDAIESAYHPSGTCRMGAANDPDAVVDPQCRVIGVENLRLADSSIFPRIPYGNLNAPSIMVGEKAADHILGRDPLPASNLEPWINPEWETRQR